MTEAHEYSVHNFMAQLPRVLYDDARMRALAYAIAKALKVHLDEIKLAEIYTRIDELPEEMLDLLAQDFKIDWYNFDYSIEAKRNAVKSNYYIHRHLGTAGAVKAAIKDIYPLSTIEEWFEYGGEPYSFRVLLGSSGGPIVPVAHADVFRALYIYKSLRSHLDGDITYRAIAVIGIHLTCGWVSYWGRLTGTYPQRARQGQICATGINIGTCSDGLIYDNPATGELRAGTFPENALRSGGIGARASGVGVAYSARLCGSTPGSLI